MPKIHLTDIAIKSLRPPKTGQITYWDDSLGGFGVRVSQGGTKSFTLMYGLSRKRRTLGRYPALSLSHARAEAKRLLAIVALGSSETPSIGFSEALDLFIATHCAKRNKPSTARETERLLRKHFEPPLRHFTLQAVSTHEVASIVDRLLYKPSEANHAFTAIRTFLRWATKRRYISHSPCEGLELPARVESRDRVLTDEEISIVNRQAGKLGYPFGTIVQLLLLTGQRRSEIGGLRWNFINFEERIITYPAAFTKNKRQHVVPYGEVVATTLDSIPRLGSCVFPARGNSDRAFSGWSKSKVAFDNLIKGKHEVSPVGHWTLHDLRRTFTTNLAALGTQIHVTEKLLNHVTGTVSGVAAIYNRHAYMDEMREALLTWEERLATIT